MYVRSVTGSAATQVALSDAADSQVAALRSELHTKAGAAASSAAAAAAAAESAHAAAAESGRRAAEEAAARKGLGETLDRRMDGAVTSAAAASAAMAKQARYVLTSQSAC